MRDEKAASMWAISLNILTVTPHKMPQTTSSIQFNAHLKLIKVVLGNKEKKKPKFIKNS